MTRHTRTVIVPTDLSCSVVAPSSGVRESRSGSTVRAHPYQQQETLTEGKRRKLKIGSEPLVAYLGSCPVNLVTFWLPQVFRADHKTVDSLAIETNFHSDTMPALVFARDFDIDLEFVLSFNLKILCDLIVCSGCSMVQIPLIKSSVVRGNGDFQSGTTVQDCHG